LREKFSGYVGAFVREAADPWPYAFRRDHTYRVCHEIIALGRELELAEEDLLLAEAAALLHDIGRFQQFRSYGTFSDRHSADHARLGLDVIREQHLLNEFSDEEKSLIEDAVACHNMPRIPPDRTGRALLFIGMLRDADKLDIWRIAVESYQKSTGNHAVFSPGLSLDGPYSPEIVQSVCQHRPASSGAIKCLDDFKLLQISWVFDLNFPETLVTVRKRGIVPAIFSTLPESDELKTVLDDLRHFLQR
jgi:putative nucleotidyltransferase with HDIG domain